MDEFGLVWLSSVWFDEVDFLKCSRSASQLSFTNLFGYIVRERVGLDDWVYRFANLKRVEVEDILMDN